MNSNVSEDTVVNTPVATLPRNNSIQRTSAYKLKGEQAHPSGDYGVPPPTVLPVPRLFTVVKSFEYSLD
jgi:hypothetical protein